MAYVFDGLTASEATFVRDALLANATGAVNKTILTWSAADWSTRNSPYLASLPVELIQAVPLLTWSSSPSHPELIDVARPPVPWWVQLAQGIASAIAQTLQFIRSGLVWLGNLAVQFAEALKNFGSWVVATTAQAVASAVQAAAEVFEQVLDWINVFIRSLFDTLIHPLIAPVLDLIRSVMVRMAEVLNIANQEWSRSGSLSSSTTLLVSNVIFGPLWILSFAIAAAIKALTLLILPVSLALAPVATQSVHSWVSRSSLWLDCHRLREPDSWAASHPSQRAARYSPNQLALATTIPSTKKLEWRVRAVRWETIAMPYWASRRPCWRSAGCGRLSCSSPTQTSRERLAVSHHSPYPCSQ
jgi:hypothetical protein